jgi:hypothetical protein
LISCVKCSNCYVPNLKLFPLLKPSCQDCTFLQCFQSVKIENYVCCRGSGGKSRFTASLWRAMMEENGGLEMGWWGGGVITVSRVYQVTFSNLWFISLILFTPYILTLDSQFDKMYNSVTLIVQFHCPTCFEPLIWVHLQGLIIH